MDAMSTATAIVRAHCDMELRDLFSNVLEQQNNRALLQFLLLALGYEPASIASIYNHHGHSTSTRGSLDRDMDVALVQYRCNPQFRADYEHLLITFKPRSRREQAA